MGLDRFETLQIDSVESAVQNLATLGIKELNELSQESSQISFEMSELDLSIHENSEKYSRYIFILLALVLLIHTDNNTLEIIQDLRPNQILINNLRNFFIQYYKSLSREQVFILMYEFCGYLSLHPSIIASDPLLFRFSEGSYGKDFARGKGLNDLEIFYIANGDNGAFNAMSETILEDVRILEIAISLIECADTNLDDCARFLSPLLFLVSNHKMLKFNSQLKLRLGDSLRSIDMKLQKDSHENLSRMIKFTIDLL